VTTPSNKVGLDDKTFPCLICEKSVAVEFDEYTAKDIATAPFDRGVECRTSGNYGSQVLDMDGTVYFILCDRCLIRNSHKMLKLSKYGKFAGILTNARDVYDEWFQSIKDSHEIGDSYMKDIGPYFEEKQ
jgi:hypothetical protein